MVDTTGDPSSLESQMRQLDKALDDSRFQMQQTANILRSKTPTGPDLDTSYKGYVSIPTSTFWTWVRTLTKTISSVCSMRTLRCQVESAPWTHRHGCGKQNPIVWNYFLKGINLFTDLGVHCHDQPVAVHRAFNMIHLAEDNKTLSRPNNHEMSVQTQLVNFGPRSSPDY